MRLSWPRANDSRRAMVAAGPLAKVKNGMTSPLRIVNTSIWDIEINHYLTGSGFVGLSPSIHLKTSLLIIPSAFPAHCPDSFVLEPD
jgi:hypothetical protein